MKADDHALNKTMTDDAGSCAHAGTYRAGLPCAQARCISLLKNACFEESSFNIIGIVTAIFNEKIVVQMAAMSLQQAGRRPAGLSVGAWIRSFGRRAFGLGSFFIGLIMSVLDGAVGQAGWAQPLGLPGGQQGNYPDFKAFLSPSRPSIQYVRLVRSESFYFNNGKPMPGDVSYEASIQPDSFYVKQMGTSYAPDTNLFTVAGSSFTAQWYLNEYGQVTTINRDPKISGTNLPASKLITDRLIPVTDVLDFGVFLLDRGSLTWHGDEFAAQSTMPDRFGSIAGRLGGTDVARPDRLDYTFSKKETRYHIKYEYQDDAGRPPWVPYKILISLTSPHFNAKANALVMTNTIDNLRLGPSNAGVNGYDYPQFLKPGTSLTNRVLVVYSNSVAYVLAGGHYEKVMAPDGAASLSPARRRSAQLRFLIGFITANLIFFGWLLTRVIQDKKKSNIKT